MLTFRFLWKFKFMFWSKLSILLQVWKAETLDCGGSIPVSQKSSRNSIEVEVDISIFLDYSVLYWHMEKHLFDSVAVASFNFHFFVILFSMTLIVDFAHSSKAVIANYVLLAEHIEIDLLCFQKCQYWIFLQNSPMHP